MTDDRWECKKCTAINDLALSTCWNCKSLHSAQVQAGNERELATHKAAEQLQLVAQQKAEALLAACSTGNAKITDLLRALIGQKVGINLTNPAEYTGAILVDVQGDFFSVKIDDLTHHVPLASVLRVISAGAADVSVGAILTGQFRVLIKVFDMIIYKGSVGIGIGIPL
jgi:hypothetical protein